MRKLLSVLLLCLLGFTAADAQIQLIGSRYNIGAGVVEVSKWDALSGTLTSTVPTPGTGIVVGSAVQDAYSGKYYYRAPGGLVQVGFSPDTADVVSSVAMASNTEIDMATGKIFAVKAVPLFDSLGAVLGQRVDFLEYNLANSTETVLGSVPNNAGILSATGAFNSNTGHYFFLGTDSTQGKCIYDIPTRVTQFSSTMIPLNTGAHQLLEIEYDNQFDVMYAVGFDSSAGPQRHLQVSSLDIQTGNLVVLGDFPTLKTYQLGSSCYDQATSTYVFFSNDTAGTGMMRLYQTQNNVINSGPLPFPSIVDPECDNTEFAAAKYGAVATSEPVSSSISIAPNPAHDRLTVRLRDIAASLEIMDASGRMIGRCNPSAMEMVVDVQGLAPGVYWVRAQHQDGKVDHLKFVVQ